MTTTAAKADFAAADRVIDALIAVEVDASRDPDCRAVMRDERMGVMSLAQRHQRPGASHRDLPPLRERIDEAVRVARNWGVDIR